MSRSNRFQITDNKDLSIGDLVIQQERVKDHMALAKENFEFETYNELKEEYVEIKRLLMSKAM